MYLKNESSSRQAARYREAAFASRYRRKRRSIHSFLLRSDQMEASFHLILTCKNKPQIKLWILLLTRLVCIMVGILALEFKFSRGVDILNQVMYN